MIWTFPYSNKPNVIQSAVNLVYSTELKQLCGYSMCHVLIVLWCYLVIYCAYDPYCDLIEWTWPKTPDLSDETTDVSVIKCPKVRSAWPRASVAMLYLLLGQGCGTMEFYLIGFPKEKGYELTNIISRSRQSGVLPCSLEQDAAFKKS